MKCPACGSANNSKFAVIDSRPVEESNSIRRRRECLNCHTRFTTYEFIDVFQPVVLKKDGMYYLFVTYTDSSSETYNNTLVFCSENPENFGEYNGESDGAKPIAKISAHAPEIIEENGKYYITTCGWPDKPIPHKGCVSIATLEWK